MLNNLFKHTPLQTSFGVNMVALVNGVPRTLNLVDALQAYVDHQVEVIRRRTEFRLKKAQDRAHIVEGLIKALDMIDAIIAAIRSSEDRAGARVSLMGAPFEFSEVQAEHILDMPLGRLTRLGRAQLEEEMAKLRETIADLQTILADSAVLRGVIKTEMSEIHDEFGDARRAIITFDAGDMSDEDLITDEDLVITMTKAGYVKAVAASQFKTQSRGGRGVQGARLKDEDLVTRIIHTSRARSPALLLQPGEGLPTPCLRSAGEGADSPGYRDRKPSPARSRRADPDPYRHPGVPVRPIPALRDPGRSGQEDHLLRVRQIPSGGFHRDQSARRGRAGRGHNHRRG